MNLLVRIKTIKNKEYIIICIILFLIVFVALFSSILKESYAFYQDSNSVPILSSKVGNFAGKGDTSPLTDKTSDVNLLFYVQDITNPKNYSIMESTPALVSGYVVNSDKSNCIPKDAKYSNYSINSADGKVTVSVSETKPSQVVCRIYYDYSKDLTKDDIIVFALREDPLGMVIYGNKHYTMSDEVPTTGYTYLTSSCSNKDVATNISYQNGKFTFNTTAPNICYAYFNKTS